MDKNFLLLLQETMNREHPLTMPMQLKDIDEWDSLSAMAFLALAKRHFDKGLKLSDLEKAKTVADLYGLLS